MDLDNKIATRESFGKALVELGKENENVVVLTADLAGATKTSLFEKEFPDRFFNIGIAEQNMIGMAAGLSTTGKIPFVSTFAVFAAGEAYTYLLQTLPKFPGCQFPLVTLAAPILSINFLNSDALSFPLEDATLIVVPSGVVITLPATSP